MAIFLILLDLLCGASTFSSFRQQDLCDGTARERDCRVDELSARDSFLPCGAVMTVHLGPHVDFGGLMTEN
jgi:hypothetical protein